MGIECGEKLLPPAAKARTNRGRSTLEIPGQSTFAIRSPLSLFPDKEQITPFDRLLFRRFLQLTDSATIWNREDPRGVIICHWPFPVDIRPFLLSSSIIRNAALALCSTITPMQGKFDKTYTLQYLAACFRCLRKTKREAVDEMSFMSLYLSYLAAMDSVSTNAELLAYLRAMRSLQFALCEGPKRILLDSSISSAFDSALWTYHCLNLEYWKSVPANGDMISSIIQWMHSLPFALIRKSHRAYVLFCKILPFYRLQMDVVNIQNLRARSRLAKLFTANFGLANTSRAHSCRRRHAYGYPPEDDNSLHLISRLIGETLAVPQTDEVPSTAWSIAEQLSVISMQVSDYRRPDVGNTALAIVKLFFSGLILCRDRSPRGMSLDPDLLNL